MSKRPFGLFPCDSSLVFRYRSHSQSPLSSPSRSRSRSRSLDSRSRSQSPVSRSRSRSQSPDSPLFRSQSPVSADSGSQSSGSADFYCREDYIHDTPVSIEGTKVDIVSLLCSSTRNFLVDKNGNKISVFSLVNSGKYIIILCCELPVNSFSQEGQICWALKAALSTPFWSNHCQLVVALTINPKHKHKHKHEHELNDNDLFYSFLSALPNSLAIPLWDSASYDRVSEFLYPLAYTSPVVILDPNHIVLAQNCDHILAFGANSFPFTDDHISTLQIILYNYRSSDRPVFLEDLLGLRLDDSLSNVTATATTSVSDLKNKLVGLYLFYNGNLSTKLITAYKQCQAKHLELEIVVIYTCFTDNPLHFNACATEFLINQGITSWWVLPFDDSTSRRLWKLCNQSVNEKLIIVGPQGRFFEMNGANAIIYDDMYPYAAEPLALQHTARLQNHTLESLLRSSTTTTTTTHEHEHDDHEHDCLLLTTLEGGHIPVKQLQGKRVLVFIANIHPDEITQNTFNIVKYKMTSWCNYHKEYYHHNKCSEDIAMVFVPVMFSNEELPLFSDDLMALLRDSTMPWLICPPGDPVREARIVKDTNLNGFDRYGHDSRLLSCLTFREDGRIVSEAWPRLMSDHNWANDELYSQLLRKYTYKLDDYGFNAY